MYNTRLMMYVVRTITSDYKPKLKDPNHGMSGPNIVDDVMTLATCKRQIRQGVKSRLKEKDVYIMGISPSNISPRRALFLMNVEECITFKDAWERGESNETYLLKRGGVSPLNSDLNRVHMNGDIILKPKTKSEYRHIGGVHYDDWHTKILKGKTIGSYGDTYLVGDKKKTRWYGSKGPIISEEFLQKHWKGYPIMRGHRVLRDNEVYDILTNLFNIT